MRRCEVLFCTWYNIFFLYVVVVSHLLITRIYKMVQSEHRSKQRQLVIYLLQPVFLLYFMLMQTRPLASKRRQKIQKSQSKRKNTAKRKIFRSNLFHTTSFRNKTRICRNFKIPLNGLILYYPTEKRILIIFLL